MADLDLRVDYKDDILDSSVNTKRKYNIIENEDGTKSLEDVSVYTQNGDSFGAADINKTNQAVLDLNSSLTLDFSNASPDVQDVKTLLQKTLEKLFPLKSIINFIVSTASNWINVAGMNFNAYDGYVTFVRVKGVDSGRWAYYQAYYSKKVNLGEDSTLQIAGILSMAFDGTPNNQDSMKMIISISDDAENWIDIGTAMTHSAYSAGTFNSSTPFSQTFDLSAYAGTSKYIAVKLADGWGNRQLTAKFTQFSLS